VPAGSIRPTHMLPVPLPGFPGTIGTLLPGRRLVLCSQQCYLDAIGEHSVRKLKAAVLADASWVSLTADKHILYMTTLGGVITSWDLKMADPAVSVTTAGGIPGIQAGATANYILLAYNSTLELVPTPQDGIFANVLKIARAEVVRSLTAAERKEYLAGAASG